MDHVGGGFAGNEKLHDNLARQRFVDCRPRFSPEEAQTVFQPHSRPYQLDHVFAAARTEQSATRGDVIREPVVEDDLSDHAPVLVEFDPQHAGQTGNPQDQAGRVSRQEKALKILRPSRCACVRCFSPF